jgi:ornithine decarboxylase
MKPKFVISKSKAIKQYNKIKKLSDIVSYSSKTNPIITKILEKNTDSMFSIHMENELKNIENKKRIIFLAQAWNKKQIINLLSKNISNFVVDNENDLNELLKVINNQNKKINLFLRIRLKEHTLKTERYFVFGMESKVINNKVKSLKNNPKIKNVGIHFHRKSQNMSEWNLLEEFKDMINKENIKLIDMVNIGGGIPSIYANTNEDAIKTIFPKLLKFKGFLNKNKIKMVIEPGRFIAAPSAILKTQIINKNKNEITINASVYNSDMDALIIPVKLLVKQELNKTDAYVKPYIIKGITPCSMDLFRYRVYLKNPKKGDEIIFINAGAYNFASDFCDLKKIKTEIVRNF